MPINNNRNRAWVLGMFETGLTAVRSLGRAGIPVTGVDWNPNMPGCFSRYGKFERAPSPVEEPVIGQRRRGRRMRLLFQESESLLLPRVAGADCFYLF